MDSMSAVAENVNSAPQSAFVPVILQLTLASCLPCKRVMLPIAINPDNSVNAWMCPRCQSVVQPALEWNIFTQRFDTKLTSRYA
jgi:hypothetical protein